MLAWQHLAPSPLHVSVTMFRVLKRKVGISRELLCLLEGECFSGLSPAACRAAALTLLQQSYTSRDQVCVIPFCGDRAEVLLPPSKSIAMARKRMDSLPCGGGSPLAHGISLVRAMPLQRGCWQKLVALTCKSPTRCMLVAYSSAISF